MLKKTTFTITIFKRRHPYHIINLIDNILTTDIFNNSLKKDIKSPSISKGLKKSSKKKQRLYIKLIKTKTLEDEFKYKTYKSLLKKLRKKKAKITY